MRFIVMFITAVCVLFLVKLRWPKTKSIYDSVSVAIFVCPTARKGSAKGVFCGLKFAICGLFWGEEVRMRTHF